LTLSQTYIDIGALKFAYEGYKNFVSEKGEHGHLPGVYLNNDQLFYISFAQVCLQTNISKRLQIYSFCPQTNLFQTLFFIVNVRISAPTKINGFIGISKPSSK